MGNQDQVVGELLATRKLSRNRVREAFEANRRGTSGYISG
jgi:hypothetical protein